MNRAEKERLAAWKAAKYTTSSKVLRELSKHECEEVRANVAFNPNTPQDILTELSKDIDLRILYWLARNTKTTSELLMKIASKAPPCSSISSAILHNPNATEDIIMLVRATDFIVNSYYESKGHRIYS
jgi:hypothetical protein